MLIVFCLAFMLIVSHIVFFSKNNNDKEANKNQQTEFTGLLRGAEKINCDVNIEKKTVSGGSLSGLIENGSEITFLNGYYNCHGVERNDIVLYQYKGNIVPIIKIVKAIPGDNFVLLNKGENTWEIIVNNEALTNSNGDSYLIDEKGYKMLSLYQQDYNGIIPKDTYLILGNLPGGTLDTTKFGLINKADILGRVQKIQ